MYRKILLAVDGSPQSDKAADTVRQLAALTGAKVLVVHAYPHTSDLLGYTDFESLVAQRKAKGQEILARARHLLAGQEERVTEDLLEGPEADAIITAARVQGVDLVVMGTRGLGGFERLLFGSVSRKVAHLAPCPVLLVR
jgi:nucleotide-binding universal stress UspA family protein